jgi:hypothetical protein
MQGELNGMSTPIPIRILGINEAGQESGNPFIWGTRTCPWLQDNDVQRVWHDKWHVTWRDVVVLDALNRRVAVYNLTTHDLGNPANYAELKNILLQAAGAVP